MTHRHHNHHPESSTVSARRPELSQHFLRNPRLARALAGGMRLPRGSLVLEVGPGLGIITEALADAGFRVIAVEKDVRLFRSLRARFIGRTNIECHHADFLSFRAPARPHAVVSSVPYGITSAVVRRVLASAATDAFLIVQREAAWKFAGVPRETLFSLVHKPWHEITIERAFRRTDFVPQPSVESALLRAHRRERPLVAPAEAADYRVFVRDCFGAPTMRAALGGRFTWRQIARLSRDLHFARDARPPQLTFPQWLALFRFFEHVCLGRDPCTGALLESSSRPRSPAQAGTAVRLDAGKVRTARARLVRQPHRGRALHAPSAALPCPCTRWMRQHPRGRTIDGQ